MIGNITIFDCTFREAGYQTGWFFDEDFCRDYYKFAQSAGIDYLELGFFHNKEADPNRGHFRYCSLDNEEIKNIFSTFCYERCTEAFKRFVTSERNCNRYC